MLSLEGKVVLFIGLGQSGSQGWGIGTACAVLFARQGALIFGGNRTLDSTAKVEREIRNTGRQCDIICTEATSAASVKTLVDACLVKHGRIDILVSNVGYSEAGTASSMNEKIWKSQLDVNLNTAYLACHFVLPVMETQPNGGAIICISSVAGLRYVGKPQIGYNTAKAAMLQFVKASAVWYADKGIRLNAVVPGLIDTPHAKALSERFPCPGGYDEFCRMRSAQVPMGKMGDAWDVAHAALFLASDEARYITGQNIVVDGGLTSSTGQTNVLV